jgi:hypothetical protein
MSLRAFHMLFIALSVVMLAFCAAWSVGMYRAAHEVSYVLACAASVISVIGLSVYGATFRRKTRAL